MKYIGNTFKIRRFKLDPKAISLEKVLQKIKDLSFDLLDEYNPLENKDSSLQPIPNYTSVFNGDDDQLLFGDYVVFLYSTCSQKVNTAQVDLELRREVKKELEKNPKAKEHSLMKSLKKEIVERMKREAKKEYKLKPVILNHKTGEGFILGASETEFNNVLEYISLITDNQTVEVLPFIKALDFLIWLWWRVENNATKEVLGSEVVAQGDVEVVDAQHTEKIKSTSDNLEEPRLALLRGLYPVRLAIAFVFGGNISRVTYDGTMQWSLKLGLENFQDTELAKYAEIFEKVSHLINISEALEAEYLAEGLTDDQIGAWARGDFCVRNFNGL